MPEIVRGATIAQARRVLTERFRAGGIESPELDARILIGHALHLDHAGLASASTQPVSDDAAQRIEDLATRRLAGEPVARIVGEKEFWGLPLAVTPAVLVPRPDTETIVELALEMLDRSGPRTQARRIADLGTGSGAILLALLGELPNAHGTGTDIDPAVLAVARANAQRLNLGARASFVETNYGEALSAPFDLVVSNPPYIASGDIASLAREVREHDPRGALDGGADGLAAYRAIAKDAPRLLSSNGHLVVEIGAGQQKDVEFLLTSSSLAIAAAKHDLSGIPRAIAARQIA